MKVKEVNIKKLFSFAVLILLLFSFSLNFVVAKPDIDQQAQENVFDPIRSWFGEWTEGNLSPNIAKYLFWILISMVVFSIGKRIPGLQSLFEENNIILGAAFSLIIGFLSMAYITPGEVYTIMAGYSALGYVIGGFLPFIILLTFTFDLAKSSGSASKKFTNKVMAMLIWSGFTIFLFVKGISPTPGQIEVSRFLQWVLIGGAFLITVSMSTIFDKVRKWLFKEEVSSAQEITKKSVARDKINAEALDETAE
jgi:hypothetical protein